MDWSSHLTGDQLVCSLALAGAAVVALGVLFGFGRRTVGLAVFLALAANVFYPGGAVALLVDALRPLRALTDVTAARRDARSARIEGATAPDPKR
jgi:hypothetical protein